MDTSVRPAVLPVSLMLALAALVNLVVGMHYALADGGSPARTSGNHLGGLIHLATSACVLIGIMLILRSSHTTRKLLSVGLLSLLVATSGFVAGQAAVRNGLSCACEVADSRSGDQQSSAQFCRVEVDQVAVAIGPAA